MWLCRHKPSSSWLHWPPSSSCSPQGACQDVSPEDPVHVQVSACVISSHCTWVLRVHLELRVSLKQAMKALT